MVLSLIGYTASGKTVIAKELEKLDYKRMVTYTTRNIRPNEIDGFDYHFISKCDFLQKIKEGFFAEFTSYQVYDEKGNSYKKETL